MDDKLQQARMAEDILVRLLKSLQEPLTQGTIPLDERLDLGQELWKAAWHIEKLLETIKAGFRTEAVNKNKGRAGKVYLESSSGTQCTVAIPQTKTVVKKNADMAGLKALLGAEDFTDLFEENTSYKPRKDFSRQASRCASEKQSAVMAVVEMVDETPNVFFKRD